MPGAWRLVLVAWAATLAQVVSQTAPPAACPAGQALDGAGVAGVCSRCPAGRQSIAGGIACEECLATTSPNADQSGCICTTDVATQDCSPGKEFNRSSGACTQCPEGKQSPGGQLRCSYCRFTLRPTVRQDGCECAELHFNMWNSSRGNPDLGCTPCSAVKVKLAGGETSSCQASGTRRECGTNQMGDEIAGAMGGRSQCDKSGAQCECSGGAKGHAPLCARAGFFITDGPNADEYPASHAAFTLAQSTEFPPPSGDAQAAEIKMIQCISLRAGKPSRCQHWSKCVDEANIYDDEDVDPYTPYIDDHEFAVWLNISGREESCPHATNCCHPGFGGKLCDYCINDELMKIGQACVSCDASGVNFSKVCSGLALSLGFTIFIMKKATTTFQDADGTVVRSQAITKIYDHTFFSEMNCLRLQAIAIFYFQIVALLFKDRAAEFGWFVVGLISFMELGFLRNSETTCVVKLGFYANFYYSVFSTILCVSCAYMLLVGLCYCTSIHHHSKKETLKLAEEVKAKKVCEHLLAHIPLFEHCTGEQLDVIASAMTLVNSAGKHRVIKKDKDPKGVFVVVINGVIEVEHVTGRRGSDLMGTYSQGHHYGEGSLFSHGSKHIRIRAKVRHTTVMTLTKARFMMLKAGGSLVCEAVLHKLDEVQAAQDTAVVEAGMAVYAGDSSGQLNQAEAAAWLRARRFDPSKEFLQALFDKFDSNGDQQISRTEFVEVLREADQLEDHFNRFDADDSGTIDVAELGAVMKACGEDLSGSDIKKLAKKLDSNLSGDIDFDEFCEMMMTRKLDMQLAPALRDAEGNTHQAADSFNEEDHGHLSQESKDKFHSFRGVRSYSEAETAKEEEAVKNTDEMLEQEELVERILIHQYKSVSRRNELTRTIEVKHGCCVQVSKLLKTVNVELTMIYEACSNSTAQKCAVLEMVIALYGPLTLVAMSMLFCWEIDDVMVLVVDSTQQCFTPEHNKAYYFAWLFLALLTIGCPMVMWYAALSFYENVSDDNDSLRKHAKQMAKARYHSSWQTLTKKERRKAIERCAHELRQEIMGASSFLLTSFQMSVTQDVCNWYPQWHLLRRTLLNFLYFEGMRSGNGTVGFAGFSADWRVLVVVILAVSNLLQTYFEVFRDSQEDKLEMWALHFLLVVVVIDIANEDISLYLSIVLSLVFMVLVVHDWVADKTKGKTGKKEWNKIKVLQVSDRLASENLKGETRESVAATKQTLAKNEKKEAKKEDKRFKNPIFDGPSGGKKDDDDSEDDTGSEEETTTPTAAGRAQLDLIKASVKLGALGQASPAKPPAKLPAALASGNVPVSGGELKARKLEEE